MNTSGNPHQHEPPSRRSRRSSNRADLAKDPGAVAGMFDQVAPRYDLTNLAMSMGNDAFWRAATTRAVDPQPGERVLDLGAGTGASSASLARRGARVVAADFSAGMLAEAKKRHGSMRGLEFVQADATDLPFDNAVFDAVTMSYSLRNVREPRTALAELFRVTKPGGRVVINEFSTPPRASMKRFSTWYNGTVLPKIARVTGSNAEAYDYLNESINDWPDQTTLASWMRAAGWTDVQWRNLTFGMVALHRATKPTDA